MDEEKNFYKPEEVEQPPPEDEINYESDSSSERSEGEMCPICLLSLSNNSEVGVPVSCNHFFCFACIAEWSKVVQTCPIDRKEFNEILVYGNLECSELLRTVPVNERLALPVAEEFTACEICSSIEREDSMLLCDECDKGFHMDCLDPPLLQIPYGDWHCPSCSDTLRSSSDEESEESEELAEEELPLGVRATRRQQPQILRTMQSERIRNAILARMSMRSAREDFGEGPSRAVATTRRATTRRAPKRRRTRYRTEVVEYDVDSNDKFAVNTRRRVVKKRKGRKKRKVRKARKPRASTRSAATCTATSFKNANQNVHELQQVRMRAGLSGFSIFEPANQLDYIPDVEDSGIEEIPEFSHGSGSVATASIINYVNPQRRIKTIQSRVMQNLPSTSNSANLLDSILQDQDLFRPGSITNRFAVEKSSGKLVFTGNEVKKSAGGQESSSGSHENVPASSDSSQQPPSRPETSQSTSSNPETVYSNESTGNVDESQNLPNETFHSQSVKKPTKKPGAIDMFDENPEEPESCPIFSIYDSVNQETAQPNQESFTDDNEDLVQMSDNEQHESPPAIVASQPASPDEAPPERSYTPPIMVQKTSEDGPEKDPDKDDDKRKKEKESRRNKKRDLERYNVRDRLKDRSPGKRTRDVYGRNRSRSESRKKHGKRKSRSRSRSYRRSRSRSRRRSFTRSRSRSRRRSSSFDHERRKKSNKNKKASRRSRSRSYNRPTTPDRRARSKSKKSKKKRHRDFSREKPSTLTKEVFTSGQNILVSVNFNHQEDRTPPNPPKDVVDITAKKKIQVSSKPVAIIDLARSPFRELTPEYQSNVIELSDSEGEKNPDKHKKPPKSPDSSSKLYDPFDILNSPTNDNVTSSQTSAQAVAQKIAEKPPEPVKSYPLLFNKSILPPMLSNIFTNEENLVSSSSSHMAGDKLPPMTSAPPKIDMQSMEKIAETVPMDIAESPYSPGHEYDDSFLQQEEEGSEMNNSSKNTGKGSNIFEELFGSTTPPGLEKSHKKHAPPGDKSTENNKYLMKMKRQERVIEEVKLVIKPHYSKRLITKEQYKEIMRKAVPKICHSREINPQKIKTLIEGYVKFFRHRKRRSGTDEIL